METNRRKVKLSGKKLRKVIIITVVVLAVLTAVLLGLRARVTRQFGSKNDVEISTAEVTRGSISTSVYSSGLLTDDDVEQLTIPDGVELKEIRVNPGDKVENGAVLATVDIGTVMTAMSDITDDIAAIDAQLSSAASGDGSGYISSSVTGRVKKIYAAAGDNVAALMYKNGALMLLSLDGYMAVDVNSTALAAGDSVTAQTAAGTSVKATVDTVLDGVATVLISDSAIGYGESAEIYTADGDLVGSGEAYIHDELKIMGYTGTVAYVSVSENTAVGSGSVLMTLSDTSSTSYASLLSERAELEDELKKLISIYNNGAFCAEFDGTVLVINAQTQEDAKKSTSTTSDSTTEQYISMSPDKTMSLSVTVDESDILSVSVGQRATVTVDAIDDATFNGEVSSIDKVGTSSSGVTVYTAEVSVEKGDGMLSGMSASATISIDGTENALLIPTDALNKTSDTYYVYTSADSENGTLGGMVEVTIGISNSNYTEILSGLTEGETVYYIEKDDSGFGFGFSMPGGDFGGGMPSGGGGMPNGNGGGMPNGGGGMPNGGGMPGRG